MRGVCAAMDENLRWKAAAEPTTVYARESLPTVVRKSIFLAGPTPRKDGTSWRADAIRGLAELGFDGHVFIPEPRDGVWAKDYLGQVDWEEEALHAADCIVFWVPRDLTGETYGCPMPAFTTNDEWGYWKESGKVVWGSPKWAQKVRYQQHYADKLDVPNGTTLRDTLQAAVSRLGGGSERVGGSCQVPLHIWTKPEFQSWLKSQEEAGNRLDGCRVVWTFWVGEKRDFLFAWALHVDMWIGSEGRSKTNEFVLFRTDIAAVVLYAIPSAASHSDPMDMDNEVVLVREYRSPVRNDRGFVFEIPGGSSKEDERARELAAHEVEEETGLKLDPGRLEVVGTRQVAATLSAHVGTVFIARLNTSEMDQLRKQAEPRGVEADSERTYVEVWTVRDILKEGVVDWATIGMIFAGLHS